jgi:hypothetical protein
MHFSDKDPTDLGNVLTGLGYTSRADLQEALGSQDSLEVLLGRFLISRGLINEAQLQEALQVQQDLRSQDKFKRAMASAKLAVQSRTHIRDLALAISEKSGMVRQASLVKARGR